MEGFGGSGFGNPGFGDPGFGGFFAEMPLFFKIFGGGILLVIVCAIGYTIVKGVTTWSSNNAAELRELHARILDKRTKVWGGSGDSSAKTDYFITFELQSGERVELQVKDTEYGLLTAGDEGMLTYQGTRYRGFVRGRAPSGML